MIWYFCWTIMCIFWKFDEREYFQNVGFASSSRNSLSVSTTDLEIPKSFQDVRHDVDKMKLSLRIKCNCCDIVGCPHPNSELRSRICEGLFTFSLLADPLTSFDIRSSFFSASSFPLLCEISRMLNAAKRPMTTPTVAPASTSTGWWRWSEILEREAKAARRRERSWSQGPRRRDWLEETLLLTYTWDHDGDGYDWEDDDTMTKAAAKHESWAWPEGKDFMESCSFLSSTCDPSNRMSNSSFYLSCAHWDVELNISGGK